MAFSLVCASCVVFVGYLKATHPLCAPHPDTVWLPRSHCWVQYRQLYVLNDTQRGLHPLWPFCKTGVASDQCSVCVCLAYYPLYLKTKNGNLLLSTKGSLSICLTFCEQMHCGSGAANFSQQTADAGVVQQHPEDSAGTQPRLSQPHQHRRHTVTVPDAASVTCCRTPPPCLFAKVPLKKKQLLLSFHSWWAAIACHGHNLSNGSNCFKLRQAVENTQPHAELHVPWNASGSPGIRCFSIRKASFHR